VAEIPDARHSQDVRRKPDLSAPAPRTADGKIDLYGVWAAAETQVRFADDEGNGAPLTAWVKAIREERRSNRSRDIPTAKCLPSGVPPDMLRPTLPFKIVQAARVTVILLEPVEQSSLNERQSLLSVLI
jgi:hypothetical protein